MARRNKKGISLRKIMECKKINKDFIKSSRIKKAGRRERGWEALRRDMK